MCGLLVITLAVPHIAYGEEKKMSLEDKISYASNLLGQVMNAQYDNAVKEIKKEIAAGGHDYTYSMESFLDMGNPFREMDFIGLLATYSAIKSRLKETDNNKEFSLKSIEYISYKSEVVEYGENEPYKIEEYTAVDEEGGLYERTGYRYSTEEEDIPVFDEIKDGVYKLTGTKHMVPEKTGGTYLEITMKAFEVDDLFEIAGIEKDKDIEEDIKRRRNILETAGDNDAIRAGMVMKLPDGLIDMDSWNRDFLDKIGYTDDDTPIRIDGEKVAAIASLLEGQVPYEWGGKSRMPGYDTSWWTYDYSTGLQKGLDCSGFVQWTYRTAGFPEEVTRTLLSTHIMDRGYEAIDRKDIRPGDIGLNMTRKIGHCGIYAGNGKWWHCSSSSGTVTLEDGSNLGFHKVIRPVDLDEEYIYRKIRTVNYGEQVEEVEDDEREAKREVMADVAGPDTQQGTKEDIQKSTEETAKEDVKENVKKDAKEDNTEQEQTTVPPSVEDEQDEKEKEKTDPDVKSAEEKPPEQAEPPSSEVISIPVTANVQTTDSDVMLLAQLMHHEALNQGPNGWIAVGEVVVNRVKSPLFPNDIRQVILQKGQFTNSSSLSSINPSEEMIKAAKGVLEGRLSVLGNTNVLYFRNAGGKTGNWGKHVIYTKLGQHTFYLQ